MARPAAFSIWAVISLLLMGYMFWAAWQSSRNPEPGVGPVTWVNWLPFLLLQGIHAVLTYSFWKMSRIPTVIALALVALSVVGSFFVETNRNTLFWTIGLIVPTVLAAAFAVTVIPHWKNMTWSPLGRHDFGSPKGAH